MGVLKAITHVSLALSSMASSTIMTRSSIFHGAKFPIIFVLAHYFLLLAHCSGSRGCKTYEDDCRELSRSPGFTSSSS